MKLTTEIYYSGEDGIYQSGEKTQLEITGD
jgi:hypothetical protein